MLLQSIGQLIRCADKSCPYRRGNRHGVSPGTLSRRGCTMCAPTDPLRRFAPAPPGGSPWTGMRILRLRCAPLRMTRGDEGRGTGAQVRAPTGAALRRKQVSRRRRTMCAAAGMGGCGFFDSPFDFAQGPLRMTRRASGALNGRMIKTRRKLR